MIDSPQIVLAIESAVAGGSISLLQDGREIANWVGTSGVSKAEELLVNIDDLLRANRVRKQDIDLIAVSAGPGSFTGIRIGIATALGLKAGLAIEISSESALKAMAFLQPDGTGILVGIPMGRNAVCLQSFKKQNAYVTALDEPKTMPEDTFLSTIQDRKLPDPVLHSSLYEKVALENAVANFGSNIAYAVGVICLANEGVLTAPLFVSKTF